MGRTLAILLEKYAVRASLSQAILLAVGGTILAIQALTISHSAQETRQNVEAAAGRQADVALDMLAALHTSATAGRNGTGDGDAALAALDATMDQFSRERREVSVWLVMGDKIAGLQKRNKSDRIERARDPIDQKTLDEGRAQSAVVGGKLRRSRPVIMKGETIGVYSAAVDLSNLSAAAWAAFRKDLTIAAGLAIVSILMLLVVLRTLALRPLERLTESTQLLADDKLDSEIAYTTRPDEVGKIARALEAFRAKLIERKSLVAQNEYNSYLAQHDMLTRLPNRLQYLAKLDVALAEARARGGRVLAVVIDVNRFKHINDRYGHEAGDAVLASVAGNGRRALQPDEFLARFGGDEFAAFKPVESDGEIDEFVQRLAKALSSEVCTHGARLNPSVCLGMSVHPDDASRREELVNNADLAMNRAKADPSKSISRFDREMDEKARFRRDLADDLEGTLRRNEFEVHYQLQNNAVSCAVIGCEALLRWNHPEHGTIGPTDFIPIAEENGSIVEIGNWVLGQACAMAARHFPPAVVAVNVSARQISEPGFVNQVREALLNAGLPPAGLELEITETALISQRETALHVMRQIRAMGVTIALDDFGIGYSSLETVNLFPIDKIKIDRSFIRDFETQPKARSLVSAMLSIGEALGIAVLAEGVETLSQLELARSMGCDQVQGYLFSRPCREEDLDEQIACIAAAADDNAARPGRAAA